MVHVSFIPAVAGSSEAVFVTARSAVEVMVSVSVAELLPEVGSVVPPGAATGAVFARDPVAEEFTVALMVNVAVPPARRLTEAEMSPEPEAGQLEPAEATHVQVMAWSFEEKVSVTVAPVTSEGPLFVTTTV